MGYTKIGNFIRIERIKKRFTQQELADLIGVSRVFLCQVENGLYRPSLSTLRRLAIVFEMKPERLYKELIEL